MRVALILCFLLVWIELAPNAAFSNAKATNAGTEHSKNQNTLPVPPQFFSATGTHLYKICLKNILCYKENLSEIVEEQGTERALRVIEQIVEKDRVALREAHNLTHHVGRIAYRHLKNVTTVMSQCTAAHQSGCYHGALEAYFSSEPHVKPDDVVAICSPKLEKEKGQFAYFNCFHGLGHGLTMYVNHDMKKALSLCDTLNTQWDRESCYGGVFMETVVTGTRDSHHHHREKQDHHQAKLIDPENPLYPCSAIEKKYWRECYMMQTGIILHLTHDDFAKAFRICDGAPHSMRPICYQSMGRDISGHTLRDIKKSISLCGLGTDTYQGRCFVGVVKNFINVKGRASDDAFEFCRQTPTRHKKECHFAIGEELVVLHPQSQQRTHACARSEATYIQNCRRGARLPRNSPSQE